MPQLHYWWAEARHDLSRILPGCGGVFKEINIGFSFTAAFAPDRLGSTISRGFGPH